VASAWGRWIVSSSCGWRSSGGEQRGRFGAASDAFFRFCVWTEILLRLGGHHRAAGRSVHYEDVIAAISALVRPCIFTARDTSTSNSSEVFI
jgi:hypothetical protein